MMELSWDDELNTGIPEIDTQNRKIVVHIKTLEEARRSGDTSKVGEVLELLLEYAVNHFFLEEHLMEQANYGYRAAHERIHELFAKQLANFRGRHADGEDVSDELSSMLTTWVHVHIREEDQGYAERVRKTIEQQGGNGWISGLVTKVFGRPSAHPAS